MTQIYRAKKVEECYGDLDRHYENDRLQSVISELKYSKEDERQNKPNPSKIRFRGNIRNNLASYRNATERYRKFRDEESGGGNSEVESEEITDNGRLIGLERDMQAALRSSIEQLEPGLEIIDGGAEHSVSSGFIDITAKGRGWENRRNRTQNWNRKAESGGTNSKLHGGYCGGRGGHNDPRHTCRS